MSGLQIHRSFTGFLSEKNSAAVDYFNNKLSTKDDIGYIKRATKEITVTLISTVGSAFHAVLTVASLVEAVVRHVLAITVKVVTFLLPSGISYWIDNKVVKPLFKHAQLTLESVPKSATRIVTNFLSEKTRLKVDSKISFSKLYDSNLFKGIYYFHWTGLSKKSQKMETSSQENTVTTPNDLEERVAPQEKQTSAIKKTEDIPTQPKEEQAAVPNDLKGKVTSQEEQTSDVEKATVQSSKMKEIWNTFLKKGKSLGNWALEKTKHGINRGMESFSQLSTRNKFALGGVTFAAFAMASYWLFFRSSGVDLKKEIEDLKHQVHILRKSNNNEATKNVKKVFEEPSPTYNFNHHTNVKPSIYNKIINLITFKNLGLTFVAGTSALSVSYIKSKTQKAISNRVPNLNFM